MSPEPTPPAPSGPAANLAPGLPASCGHVTTEGCGNVTTPPVAAEPLLPPAFAEAWINYPHTVCRRRLPAYSLHTHFMLCAVESPFAYETLPPEYKITWEDLWEALAAVLTPYGGCFRTPRPWLCVFTQRLHRLDLATEVAKFRAWQNDYLSAPEVFSTEGDGRELTAPGILARVVFLQRHTSETAQTIWLWPIGQALWYHATTLEQITEHVSLLDDETARQFAYLKRLQDGLEDPDDLPGEPPAPESEGALLHRARAGLGL